MERIKDMLANGVGNFVSALIILIIGLIVIRFIMKALRKLKKFEKLDQTMTRFILNFIKWALYVMLIIAVIGKMGVPMTEVIAVLASAGLAVGLALQGALSNLAGGLMILIFKPFKVGDYIASAGAEGTVQDISVFYTTITTVDNKKVLVPNGDLMNATVTNFTGAPQRRIDQDFKITNDIDAEKVKAVLLAAAGKTAGVLSDPAPFARLTGVDDDTYIFTVRAWCETAQYWDVYFDLIENCSKALSDNHIDDPEERIAIRIVKDED